MSVLDCILHVVWIFEVPKLPDSSGSLLHIHLELGALYRKNAKLTKKISPEQGLFKASAATQSLGTEALYLTCLFACCLDI
jgi:hypothetical protein